MSTIADLTRALRCPWPPRLHPDVDIAARHTIAWLTGHEVISDLAVPRFAAYRLERYSGRIAPRLPTEALLLLNDWVSWGTEVDDACEVDDPTMLTAVMNALSEVLRQPPDTATAVGHPLARGLADLWTRTAQYGDVEQHRLLADRITGWLRTYSVDAEHRRDRLVLGVERYLDHRKWASAMPAYMQITAMLNHEPIPPSVGRTPIVAMLHQVVLQHVSIVNDLFSVDREHSRHDTHNLVLALCSAHGLDRTTAIHEAIRMADDLVALFELLSPRCPDPTMLAGMREWMRGNFDWHSETPRYEERGKPQDRR